MQIQAAVLRTCDGPYELETVELAEPGPDEMVVRIAGVGMCHTDFAMRAPDFGVLPLIPGHEGAGEVVAVGTAAGEVEVGDKVCLTFDCCGSCANCRAGRPARCHDFFGRNLFNRDGGRPPSVHDSSGAALGGRWFQQSSFATHALVTTRNIVKVGQESPLELFGPLGCSLQTGAGTVLNTLSVEPGTGLAVLGCGAVGLAAVMAAKLIEADPIIAVDLNPQRLALAKELGATHVIHSGESLAKDLMDVSAGGVGNAVDTTGVPSVIAAATAALRPFGRLALVGVTTGPLVLDPMDLAVGRGIISVVEGDAVPQVLIPQLIEWWSQGRFPFDRMIRHYPLSEINTAERDAVSGAVVKAVLLPG